MKLDMLCMTELPLAGKRVLIREDLNVPVEGGCVMSDVRIRAALPTLNAALNEGAAVMVCAHLGRPDEGASAATQPACSLAPVAARLGELLGRSVPLVTDWLGGVEVAPGQLVLLENVRWNKGEKDNRESLARQMAKLCDVFVMDAFGTAHRAQASTQGVARFAPLACAGPLLLAELAALNRALAKPQRPLLAIIGGSKVSTKLDVLAQLAVKADRIIVGGGIANTFIAAAGFSVGASLYEPDFLAEARRIAGEADCPIPTDVVVADRCAADAPATMKPVSGVGGQEIILDIGSGTAVSFARALGGAGTILWNGPVGMFEFEAFAAGTRAVAEAIAGSSAFSIAGGGDTLAAIERFGVADRISYISTGGGAFLEYVGGRTLPAVAVLQARARERLKQ